MVDDEHVTKLGEAEQLALALTDVIIGMPAPVASDLKKRLREHFSAAELAELTLAVGLFHGMSKVLIALGMEPEQMPTTILPTPGS